MTQDYVSPVQIKLEPVHNVYIVYLPERHGEKRLGQYVFSYHVNRWSFVAIKGTDPPHHFDAAELFSLSRELDELNIPIAKAEEAGEIKKPRRGVGS